MAKSILAMKSLDFGIRVVRCVQYLQKEKNEYILSKQVLRSGTSIGANIHEGLYAQSKADFVSKLTISLKEASETSYWLILLNKTDYLTQEIYESLKLDVDELIRMIIASQVVGTGLTDIVIDENQFATQTGATEVLFATFTYDGADWEYDGNTITPENLTALYGVSFDGTPTSGDEICVAYDPQSLWKFSPGDGINMVKLNYNFGAIQQQANTNETNINTIANTALLKDGSNLTPDIIAEFQSEVPNILSGSGTITLTDNTTNFLTLTGDAVIALPAIAADDYSHTIEVIVEGSQYSLDISTATGGRHLYNDSEVDSEYTYSVLFIYNKIENAWYYSLTQ